MTKVTILDGSIGQELVNRSGLKPDGLWSTKTLKEMPELIQEVHRDYFKAGAEIATTNTYTLHRDRLARFNIEDEFESLNRIACEITVSARDAFGSGLVGGALGPTGGSYQPELAPDTEVAAELFREIATVQAPYVDFYLLETMSSVDQARGALMGATSVGKPVWLSVSVLDDDGSRLRSGESVANVLPLLSEFPVSAFLVNCSTPEAISTTMGLLAGQSSSSGALDGVPLGAYANGFTKIEKAFQQPGASVDVLEERTDLDANQYADFASRWVADGATIVGGCCCVGPAHIAELHKRFG